MKIHAYKVTAEGKNSLDAVLAHLTGLPLTGRLREISGTQLRLEDSVRQGQLWLLDFAMIRQEGPGKASATSPVQDFELAEDEGFGHETAACFDAGTGFFVLQYNHYGPRISRIKFYLNRFDIVTSGLDDNDLAQLLDAFGFSFDVVLKHNALERLEKSQIIKSIDLTMYVPGIIENKGRERQSLSSLLDSPLISHSGHAKLSVSAGRGKGASLMLQDVKAMIKDLLSLRDDVSQLEVVAKENEDAPSEPVDFIEARLEADIPVARDGRRYGRPARWDALKQALGTWLADGQLL